jgi:hypothetical protein
MVYWSMPVHRPGHCLVALPLGLIAAALTACGPHWRPLDPRPARALPTNQLVRIWRAGRPVTLAAVALAADSLSGIPWREPLECTRCRVSFAWGAIDSVHTGRTDLTSAGTVAGIAAGSALLGVILRAAWGND